MASVNFKDKNGKKHKIDDQVLKKQDMVTAIQLECGDCCNKVIGFGNFNLDVDIPGSATFLS